MPQNQLYFQFIKHETMITKEQLVCTRQQAERLKQLGANQLSIFEYLKFTDMYGSGYVVEERMGDGLAAYTSAEMVYMLPKMNWFNRFWFLWSTMLEPKKVADYLINYLKWHS